MRNFIKKGLVSLKNNATGLVHNIFMNISENKSTDKIKILDKNNDFYPKPPNNIHAINDNLKNNFYNKYSFKEINIYTFKNHYISYYGIIFKNMRLFTPSLAHSEWSIPVISSMEKNILSFLGQQWSKRAIQIKNAREQPIAVVYNYWSSGNYYHWICDALPKLLLLKKRGIKCTIAIPDNRHEYIKNTIKWFGFDDILELNHGKIYYANYIIIPDKVAGIGYQNGLLMHQIRETILNEINKKNSKLQPNDTFSRIYSSRVSARMRKVENEVDVIKLLKKYKFAIINFDDYSFEDQIRIMSKSEFIVGAHGANLTNLLFIKENGCVIEFMNKTSFNPCYYNLASNLDLTYNYLPCETTNTDTDTNNDNIIVDLAQLENLVINNIQ